MNVTPGDIPLAGLVPTGKGLCRSSNGSLVWDSGDAFSVIDKNFGTAGITKLTPILIGTSISNQTFGSTYPLQQSSYFVLAQIAGNQLFNYPLDAAVSGQTVADMRARFPIDVIPNINNFDAAILEPGPNSAHSGVDASSVIDDLQYMVTYLISQGKLVFLLSPTTSGLMNTDAKMKSALEVGEWCRQFSRSQPRVLYVPAQEVYSDPADGWPELEQAPISGDSRVHPGYGGHSTIGRALANAANFLQGTNTRNFMGKNIKDHYEYCVNPGLAGAVAAGVRNAQIVTALNGTENASSLPWSVAIDTNAAGVFTTPTTANALPKICDMVTNSRGDRVMRISVSGAAANWSRLRIRFGSTIAGQVGVAQVERWDQGWTAGQVKTIGDHYKITGDTTGILTLIALSSGDSYTTGTAPAIPANYGDTVTDGVATWLYQKLPAAGDIFQAEIPYEITSLTGGIAMQLQLNMTLDGSTGVWALANYPTLDVSGSTGNPTKYWPRKGLMRTNPATLVNPGSGLRHVYAELMIAFTAGGSAVIEIPYASLRRIG